MFRSEGVEFSVPLWRFLRPRGGGREILSAALDSIWCNYQEPKTETVRAVLAEEDQRQDAEERNEEKEEEVYDEKGCEGHDSGFRYYDHNAP